MLESNLHFLRIHKIHILTVKCYNLCKYEESHWQVFQLTSGYI